jgi:hypothetical protein
MYAVIKPSAGSLLSAIAEFNSRQEAADFVSRQSNPDAFIIIQMV